MDPLHRHVPLCAFHAATGWWCPLCGGLRAAQALSHGDVAAAVHDNIIVVAAAPILAWLWLDWLIRVRAPRAPRAWPRGARMAVVVVLIVFAIARNLPWAAALRP